MTVNKKRGTILCLTFNDFPNKDAGSVRLLAIAKALVMTNHNVKVITMGKNSTNEWEQLEEGISHKSVRNASNGKKSLIKSYFKFNSYVNSEIDKINDLRAVFVFNTFFYVFNNKRLKKLGIPLVYDSTEWYNACQFKYGFFSFEYISNMLVVKHKVRKPWRVIAISKLLENHYRKKGLCVKRIPAVMDVNSFDDIKYTPNKKIQIVYAGSPGKKDALYKIIQALKELPFDLLDRFEFKIIGLTKDQFITQCKIKDIPKNVSFIGRISRDEVIEQLANADFTTFMRDERLRFVNAGFPSKVSESMSMGIPVITNLTSDLSNYLVDGENSVVVKGFHSKDYAQALIRVANMSGDMLIEMHKAAKITAFEKFDYLNYVNDLDFLIREEAEGVDSVNI